MDLTLPCPDHTTLSRRHATGKIRRQIDRAPGGPIDLIVDSTGLKVCGQGEWQSQKHGEKRARRWKKRHIGVDARGRIVASTVTESHAQDPSQVSALISQVKRDMARFIGDGIYDQAPVYAAVETQSPGARVIIPPRQDAVLSAMARTAPTQRDQHLLAIESEGRSAWKRRSGYYAQSQAENAFSRCKRTFGGGLRSKRDACQEREAALACALLNWMQERGRPQSYSVS
jgi:transposase